MGVVNKDGALYFATGIDNSRLKTDAEEAKRYIQDISDFAKGAGAALGIAFSGAMLKNFGDQIINVRGEMQMLESSFEVLLGGKGVKGFMDGMNQFAIDSPLSLTGVSSAAQTLLGFNVAAEKVIPTLKQLGDISMGNEQRFQSLTLAFAQMSSTGKLMGQDLNQMINAGFNPLQEISARTGKSIAELKEEMEDGAISADMVAEAFRSATAEGGKFYGMTQKQAEGIRGLQAQLEGAWQTNLNELGKQSEGLISGMYKTGISIAENYEKIGKVLMALVATYGTYRAAVVAVTVAEKGYTAAQMMQYKWLLLVEKAQKLLNATMMKNPYVIVATAIVGLVSALWSLRDSTTAEEQAQAKLNATMKNASDVKESLKSKSSQLKSIIDDETTSIRAQIDAYNELIGLIPELQGKSIAEIKEMSTADISKLAASNADKKEEETIAADYEKAKKSIETIKKKIADLEAKDIREAGVIGELAHYQKQLKAAELSVTMYADKIQEINDAKEAALAESERLNKKAEKQDKEYWEKQLKEAERALSKLTKENTAQEWDDAKKNVKTAQKQVDKYSVKNDDKTVKNNTEISRGLIEMELNLNKERIAILKDGREKRLKESEQEWKEQKAALEKEMADRIAKYKELGKQMPESEKAIFTNRGQVADDSKTSRDKSINEEYDKEYISRIKDVTAVFLSEEGKKREAIRQRYEDEKEWAKKQLEGGSISEEQYSSFVFKVNEAEAKEQMDRLLSSLNDFKAQEKAISDEWNEKIAEATLTGDMVLLDRLNTGKEKALATLNAQMITQSEEWQTLFSDLDSLTISALDALITNIEDKMRSADLKLDPADLKAIRSQLDEAKQKMVDQSPFEALGKSIKNIFSKSAKDANKSTDEIKSDWTNLAKATEGSFDFINDAISGCSALGDVMGDTGQAAIGALQGVVMAAIAMATAIKTAEKGSVILAVISAALAVVNALFAIFNNDKKKEEKIKSIQKNVDNLKRAYDELGDAIERAYSTDKASMIEEQNALLEKQNDEIRKQIATEQSKRKKKIDHDAIKEWENKIYENEREIAKNNKYRIIETIVGTEILDAIDQFAEAYADAWASGEKAAKKSADVVKSILKTSLLNYMKSQLQPQVEKIMSAIADAMENDGKIDKSERAAIDALTSALDKKAAEYEDALRPYLEKMDVEGVTGELKAQMTEQTGSQLVGLWTMVAMDTRQIREHFEKNPMPDMAKEIHSLLNELEAISQNTRETADNTSYLEEGFKRLHDELIEIKKNTKPNNSRI